MPLDILVGLQYGDCGKGRITDSIAHNYSTVVRFNGGNNAGHTVQFDNIKLKLHSIPSGIAHENVLNLIGRGCVVNPSELCAEIQQVQLALGRPITPSQLKISNDCFVIEQEYIDQDVLTSKDRIGTTGKGIGPTYSAKHARTAKKIYDVVHLYPMLKPYLADVELEVRRRIKSGESILAEGAQGTWLDVDHGEYPYVTSSNTLASHACTTLGVGFNQVRDVIGVFKAYTTRVGEGSFEREWNIDNKLLYSVFKNEVGTTTNRQRRCGPLNIPDIKKAMFMNGVTKLVMVKADVLNNINFDVIITDYHSHTKTINSWSEATIKDSAFKDFVDFLEESLGSTITAVSTGPSREDYDFNLLNALSW